MSTPLDKVVVAQQLADELKRGIHTNEAQVFAELLLAEVQVMFDGSLEGHYWAVRWGKADQVIDVLDVLGQKIDEVVPMGGFFSQDFADNSPKLLRELDNQVKKIVSRH